MGLNGLSLTLLILITSTAIVVDADEQRIVLNSIGKGTNFYTVGGAAGWNTQRPANLTFLQRWADDNLNNAQQGDVLVFTSDPGTNHPVIVTTSDQKSTTKGSVCQNPASSRNQFTSNVSLVLLKTNVTYTVRSQQPDCNSGLLFTFFINPDPSQIFFLDRDVGVAYNVGILQSNGTSTNSFGSLVPPQDSAYVYEDPDHDTTFFNGDQLNVVLPPSYELDFYSNSNSPASPIAYDNTFVLKTDNTTYLLSIDLWGLAKGFQDHYHLILILHQDISSSGSVVADFFVQNVTSADTCGKKPGLPYLCDNPVGSNSPNPSPAGAAFHLSVAAGMFALCFVHFLGA